MMTRKISPIAVIRMKYQEKVSNPPPAGRGPYPVEIRITFLLFTDFLRKKPARLLHARSGITCIQTEDGANHKNSDRNEAYNGENHHSPKHAFLKTRDLRHKVNEHDAYAVKSMIEYSPDQCQRKDAYGGGTEHRDAFVIDLGTKSQCRNTYEMN